MKFDLLSDVHLDETLCSFKNMNEFVLNILPTNPSSVFVFAGDFGYWNDDNIDFLKEIKKHYDSVLYVLGNNDMKLPLSNNLDSSYNMKNRICEFIYETKLIENVFYLGEKPVTINNTTFGGSDIFYDFDDLKSRFCLNDNEVLDIWNRKKLHLKHKGWIDDPLLYANLEKQKLHDVISSSNVIVTHGPPNYFVTPSSEDFGFFCFNGDEFKHLIHGKVWCYGHRHIRNVAEKYGCRFYNACYKHFENYKAMTIEV